MKKSMYSKALSIILAVMFMLALSPRVVGATDATGATSATGTSENAYGFILPLDDMNLEYHTTSGFRTPLRPTHTGIDISWYGISGTPIRAVKDGKIIFAGWNGSGYGNFVTINHGSNLKTAYAHMKAKPLVKTGQQVKQGQVIGYVGNTGRSTGPHLHFEVRIGSFASFYSCVAVDPIPYLQNAGATPTSTSKPVAAKSVTLNKKTITIKRKKTYALKATVEPSNATNKTVTWSSANKKIATVNTKGVVKGVKKGKTTITGRTSNGQKVMCKVTVK